MDDPVASYGRHPRQSDRAEKILNQSWPLLDKNKRQHAEGIPDQTNPIPVLVRLELSESGVQLVDATAVRWNRSHVYIQTNDPRVPGPGVWVLAREVRRR